MNYFMCFKSVRKDHFNFKFNRKPNLLVESKKKNQHMILLWPNPLDCFYNRISKCMSKACITQSYSVFNLAMNIFSFEDFSGWTTEVGVT